jgi:uncharacterized protein (TIGR02145 family)
LLRWKIGSILSVRNFPKKTFAGFGCVMLNIKVLLTGLAGASLCMANISGVVIDTGSTPISGAVVQLERGGQTDTTGADGIFTLIVNTAVLPVNSRLLPNGLSGFISRNLLTVSIAQRSIVEITTYDLIGKALSIVRQSMDAGTHSITLPYRGKGVCLYKVKAGNNEIVIKSNGGGISSGNAVLTQNSIPESPAKKAMVTNAINDVIAVTKTGYLNYRCVIGNTASEIVVKMIVNAGNLTDADGNVYQTVRIGNQVWMAENLRTTKYNDGTAIPKVTDDAAWSNIFDSYLKTSAYCYYDNTVNVDSIKKFGALYNWYAVDTKKLAPAGWHVPTNTEWDLLQNYLIANGYNWDGTTTENKVAKSLATKIGWHTDSTAGAIGCDLAKNNSSGFSAIGGGYRVNNGSFGRWWSATEVDASGAWAPSLGNCSWSLERGFTVMSCGSSVRLVKD